MHAGMSRVTLLWLILHVLQLNWSTFSLAQDLSQIKPTIEKERQITRIRNKILKELVSNGAKISRSDTLNQLGTSGEIEATSKLEQVTDIGLDRPTSQESHIRSKALVTLGEPVSQAKDKCLEFNIRKYVKNVEFIIPKKIDLWIHIRKLNKKGKKRKPKVEKLLRNGQVTRGSEDDIIRSERKKSKKRSKKRRNGRRIKIFISNGTKTLVKMRMRIKKTKWYKIELPISQFPENISANNSFKLCFKCKRCSKRIKLDLYRKGIRQLNPPDADSSLPDQPTIPFIHFEEHRSHHTNRFKRSTRVKTSNDVDIRNYKYHQTDNHHHNVRHHRKHHHEIEDTCCLEEIYTEHISKVFPSIVYPESINITLCSINKDLLQEQPILSQMRNSQLSTAYTQNCVPTLFESFDFVYVTTDLSLKRASISNVIPVSCSCSTPT